MNYQILNLWKKLISIPKSLSSKVESFSRRRGFLQVYFNELTGTVAFALIEQGKRVWGVDYDKGRGGIYTLLTILKLTKI